MADSDAIDVRPERPVDEAAIARVNDAAFGQPDESRIVDAIRRAGHAAISLVATQGDTVVGHILFSPVHVGDTGAAIKALALGPMAVSPELQRRGIGTKLVEAGLRECVRIGCAVVVVIGHPEFYPRFGFVPANRFGLRSEYDVADDVFMAVELVAGTLDGRGAIVRYLPQFGTA